MLECIRSANNRSVQLAERVIVDASDEDGEALVRNNRREKLGLNVFIQRQASHTAEKRRLSELLGPI